MYKGLPPIEEENAERTKVIMMVLGGHIEVRDPLIKGRYPNSGGRPPHQGGYLIEDLLEEDILIEMGDPLAEDPLMQMEDALVMEDLLVMEDPLDLLVDKDHWALRNHLDQ